MAYWNFMHNLGLHVYLISTVIFAIAIAVVFIVHNNKQKKRAADFESKLKNKYTTPSAPEGEGQ